MDSTSQDGIAYFTTAEGRHHLCVMADGQFYRFNVDIRTVARLVVEGAERLLLVTPRAYARRIDAPPLGDST